MKQPMKRLISLALILCLTLPAALAETAAGGGDAITSFDTSVRNLFLLGSELYAQDYNDAFYRQVDGGWLPAGVCQDDNIDIWNIFSDANKVWLLIRREGTSKEPACYQISEAAFDESGRYTGLGEPVTLGWDQDPDDWPSINGLVVDGDTAYVLARHPEDWNLSRLYRVDLTSGEAAKITDEPIEELTAYKDGLLLARRFSWEDLDADGNMLPPQVVSVDPATGELTRLAMMVNLDTAALAYDAETDAAYFCDNTHVYKAAGDTPEIVGYLLPSNMGRENSSSIVYQGRYYVEDANEVSSAPIDPTLKPAHVLRIEQLWEIDDTIREYARLHPDEAIEYTRNYWDNLDEFTRIMQADDAPVIFGLGMSSDFPILRDKKYLVDLSSSQVLMDNVSAMYPHLTRELLVDGQLFALPYYVEASCLGYYPRALEKAGVPEEALPTTFDGLLDFIVTWHDDYFPDNEGMEVVQYAVNLRQSIFWWIFRAQIRASQNGETLTFDTPTIRRLLNRLDEIKPIIDVVAPEIEFSDDYEYVADGALITQNECFPMPRAYKSSPEWEAQPLLLSLDDQTPPTMDTIMNVVAVNPYTTETEAAIDLLEYIAQHQSQVFRTSTMPDCNDPIEVYGYDRELESLRNDLAAIERRLEEDPDNLELKEQLDSYQKIVADLEEQGRWAMTTEEIQWYRENIAPCLTLQTKAYTSANASEQMYTAINRYCDRQMSADEFIQEIDRIVWMVQMESQ